MHSEAIVSEGLNFHEHLAALRKEFARGIINDSVQFYEGMSNQDTILRFAGALEVSTDELLRPVKSAAAGRNPSRKVPPRLKLIESLPNHQQQTVLKTIDAMLKGLRTAR